MSTLLPSSVAVAKNILSSFPRKHVTYCFCYGSGVFKQSPIANAKMNKSARPMIDMIFVVKNSLKFHEDNLASHHRGHYSLMKLLGPVAIKEFQEEWGARVYYNTLVPFDHDICYKYGVISRNDFISDLLDWCHLYVAGRLHKPILELNHCTDGEMLTALRTNLFSAVRVSLLTLPERFTELEFYKTLANISYAGDFRTWFGEDKRKVDNIVNAQLHHFRDLYADSVKCLSEFLELNQNGICSQDGSAEARWHHLNNLPRQPQKRLVKYFNDASGSSRDTEEVLRMVSTDGDVAKVLKDCLKDIVWSSSVRQSLKGLATAGPSKSIRYGLRKIIKMLASLKK